MSTMKVEYPLGAMPIEEATERLKALGEYLQNRHGIAVAWSGSSATVKGKYLVVGIDGALKFEGQKAVFEGKDPGMLWRGKAKEYLHNKLRAYLDPKTALADLPRKA